MLAVVLALTVTAVPSFDAPRHTARLIPAAWLEDAPVERLTTTELMAEDLRLAERPPRDPWVSMSIIGFMTMMTGALSSGFIIEAWSRNGSPSSGMFGGLAVLVWVPTVAVLVAIGIVGAVFTGVGLAKFAATSSEWDRLDDRQRAVQARLDAAGGATAAVDPNRLTQVEVELLEQRRPPLGLPIGLMSGAGGVAAAGVLTYSLATQVGMNTTGMFIAAGGEFAIAGAMFGIGMWQLISRILVRQEIDHRLDALKAGVRLYREPPPAYEPPASPPPPPPEEDAPPAPPPPPPPLAFSAPPAPVLVTWGFAF